MIIQAGVVYWRVALCSQADCTTSCDVHCGADSIRWLKYFGPTSLLRAANPYPTTV